MRGQKRTELIELFQAEWGWLWRPMRGWYHACMPNWKRAQVPGGSFFFSVVTDRRGRRVTGSGVKRMALTERVVGIDRARTVKEKL